MMRPDLVRTCPLCEKELDRGVVKFRSHLKWESTAMNATKEDRELLAGSNHFAYHRGAVSAEKCASCGIVILAP